MTGFLGTDATFGADLNLVVQLIIGAALIAGAHLAKQKRYRAHEICQMSVLLLNLLMIGLVMWPSFQIVGKRLRLNPLAVTLALLFWAWIWGAMGLILAVPIVGATKIICDYVDSFRGVGGWLGDLG